ncbi:glycoside hydrolase family 3 C-terminal domain-containing protein [Flavobacterium sp. GNP002]
MLKAIIDNKENYQPGLSIDCMIFGFHDNQLKVLLIKTKYSDKWALPGGFVSVNEDVDEAAVTVLFGDYNPSGKLPMSFPREEGQIPIYYNHFNTGRPAPNETAFNYVSAYNGFKK